MNRCVAVVDPFGSGAMLAAALADRSMRCVAVVSALARAGGYDEGFRGEPFAATVVEDGDRERVLDALSRHRPGHVLPGHESGVDLADWLATRLAVPGNDPGLRRARRHKPSMAEAVRGRGLAVAEQLEARDADEALAWARARGAWPVVIKPVASVSSDGVRLCASEPELRAAARDVLGRRDAFGQRNETLLVQEHLAGREYVVDTVSAAGHTEASGYWVYDRPPPRRRGLGYDAMILMPPQGDRQGELRRFALAVIEALGIRFGAAHCEIMWTDRGPVLVECAARITAGNNATLGRLCGGASQLDDLVDAVVEPARLAGGDRPATLARRAANVFFLRGPGGRLRALPGLAAVRRLPTLHRISVSARPGEPVPRVLGMTILIGERLRDVLRDVAAIRGLARGGLYEVDGAAGETRG